jgi:hypothetical protein
MAINLKSIGKSVLGGIDDLASKGGAYAGHGLYKSNLISSRSQAFKIGKAATYGVMGGAALGVVGSLDEYQYGIGGGVASTIGGTISGAGLGAVGVGGAAAVATAIAKGLR